MNPAPQSSVTLRPAFWRSTAVLGALIVLVTLLAYLPATHCGYIWDDDVYVTENELLHAPDGLHRIWFTLDSPSQYFPLVYTTFRTEYAFWELAPAGYHWVNILIHAANALLVWCLLARLRIPGACLAAAIFALHPVHVESVAWITERKNVLMLFFFLLSLLAWGDFTDSKTRYRWRYYTLALLAHGLALSAKTTACTLPFALLLILWLKHIPINLRRLAQTIPFFMLSLGMGLLTVWWERYHQGTQGKMFALSIAERVIIAGHAVWFYAWKLILPFKLTFSYPLWTLHAWNPLAYGWCLGLLVLGWAIYCAREDLGRGPEVAALFFVSTLGPILGFIMLYTFRYSYVADHYQYAASIGPIALISAGITRAFDSFKKYRHWILASVVCILAFLGIQTWRQCHIYLNGESIWRDTLAKNPDSFMAHYNLGNHLMRTGKLPESVEHYNRALEIDPSFVGARCNRGEAYALLDRYPEALADYSMATKIDPDNAQAHYEYGVLLEKLKHQDAAIAEYNAAVKIEIHYTLARKKLADALAAQGRYAEALPSYEEIERQMPRATQSHLILARVFTALGRNADAAREYRETLRIDPNSIETLAKLSWLLATSSDEQVRNATEAEQMAMRACELTNRKSVISLGALAASYAAGGRFADAVATGLGALDLAQHTDQKTAAAALENQIASYRSGRALYEPPKR